MADSFLVTQLVDEIERTSLTGKWETGGTPGLHWARACLQWELKEAQQWFLGVGAVWIKLLSAEWLLHCTGSSVLSLECFVAGILLSSYCRNNDINPISSGGCASGRCTSNKMRSIPPLTASQQPLWPGRVPPPHIQCKSGAEIKVHFGTDHQKALESSPKRVTVCLQCGHWWQDCCLLLVGFLEQRAELQLSVCQSQGIWSEAAAHILITFFSNLFIHFHSATAGSQLDSSIFGKTPTFCVQCCM